MAAALLASGCEKFVRDELMHMQNEIDKIYGQVELLNGQLSNLRGLVKAMSDKGFIAEVSAYDDGERQGYTLWFRTVEFDPDGNVVMHDDPNIRRGRQGRAGCPALRPYGEV